MVRMSSPSVVSKLDGKSRTAYFDKSVALGLAPPSKLMSWLYMMLVNQFEDVGVSTKFALCTDVVRCVFGL